MLVKITMKSPDSLHYGIQDALEGRDLLEPEKEALTEEIWEVASKWMRGGEYLTVEMDTEKKTCVVLEKQDTFLKVGRETNSEV